LQIRSQNHLITHFPILIERRNAKTIAQRDKISFAMSQFATDHIYPGIDRWQYFLGKLGMVVSAIFVSMIFGPTSIVMKVLSLALMVTSMLLDSMRLQNIGISQFWAFIRFLPFGNLVLDLGLLSVQTGWVETRRVDDTGKRILFVAAILIGLIIFMTLRARLLFEFWF